MTEKTKDQSALIAMSGGVDSSVAAYLMREAGYRCLGVNMRLRQSAETGPEPLRTCCIHQDTEDASEAAAQLGIPYEIWVYTAEFQKRVVDKFIQVYEAGGTPNPCIDCNRYLKFGRLLQDAEARGYHYVVTGHYARVQHDQGRYLLKKSLDAGRDQSYFLYTLTQRQLAHVQFPLGGMEKAQVRELAEKLGLANARKHDSQDICFVPGGDYGAFLESYHGRAYPAGDFLDLDGQAVGRHRGAVRYTLGQRKGLGLSMGSPVYVCGKDMEANTVTVGPESALYAREILVEDLNWISIKDLDAPLRAGVKTRSRQTEQPAVIRPEDEGRVRVVFDQPQRAVTPGQAAVFYDGDTVVGGGTIAEVPA